MDASKIYDANGDESTERLHAIPSANYGRFAGTVAVIGAGVIDARLTVQDAQQLMDNLSEAVAAVKAQQDA